MVIAKLPQQIKIIRSIPIHLGALTQGEKRFEFLLERFV